MTNKITICTYAVWFTGSEDETTIVFAIKVEKFFTSDYKVEVFVITGMNC